jgi:hypothetical protein
MARVSPHVSPGTATGPPVGRKRSGSANAPTRRRRGARAELIRQLDRFSEQAPELTRRHMDWQWAIRCLQTVRGFKPPPPPMSRTDQVKLAETQADEIAGVIRAVLDGLNLSDADFQRGINLAMEALRATSAQGWEPL